MEKLERKLGTIKIAASLASVHYGLGFLLGTAEAVYNSGFAGIIYALSCSLGLVFLAFLVPFYWKNKFPIWDLLGKTYGNKMQKGSGILSWIWMVGVVGSQTLGASFILKILGVPPVYGMLLVVLLISLLAIRPIKKLSSIYFYLLLASSVALLYILTKLTPEALPFQTLGKDFFRSISLTPLKTLGIFIPTIFVTILGMDFHQFIVRGKTVKNSVWGTIFSGIFLILVAVILAFVVTTSINTKVLSASIEDGKEVIPFVLMYVGKSLGNTTISYLLIFALLTAALGSGSAVSKILIETVKDLKLLPKKFAKTNYIVLINSFLAFLIALTGRSIVSLIVSFYAIYVAGVLVPFTVYVLERKKIIKLKGEIVYSSLLAGSVSALFVLILSKLNFFSNILGENVEFAIITIGIIVSTFPVLPTIFRINLKKQKKLVYYKPERRNHV